MSTTNLINLFLRHTHTLSDEYKVGTSKVYLRQLMSETSEDVWFAGWLDDLEYILWAWVTGDDKSDGFIEEETKIKMKKLSSICGGWFTLDGFVPLEKWLFMYEAYQWGRGKR